MGKVIKPKDYQAVLDMRQTEHGIKQIKEFFQQNLSGDGFRRLPPLDEGEKPG